MWLQGYIELCYYWNWEKYIYDITAWEIIGDFCLEKNTFTGTGKNTLIIGTFVINFWNLYPSSKAIYPKWVNNEIPIADSTNQKVCDDYSHFP